MTKIKTHIWDYMPVYCFTSDVDWASEDVLSSFLVSIHDFNITPTLFVTNWSNIIDRYYENKFIRRGIHPNFLPNSSHGDNYDDVIKECLNFAPESIGVRSHREFGVTDTYHPLKEKYHFKYMSNTFTVFQRNIIPVLHESGMIELPIFFEDGTHLYNKLDLNINNPMGEILWNKGLFRGKPPGKESGLRTILCHDIFKETENVILNNKAKGLLYDFSDSPYYKNK